MHKDHDNVAAVVRHWFHDPFEEMGYSAVPRRWGTYWSNSQVYVSGLESREVGSFIDDLRVHFQDMPKPIYIHIDNPQHDVILGPALLEAGCAGPSSDLFLAHVGPLAPAQPRNSTRLEPVGDQNLASFADTKLRAWSGSEDDPGSAELDAEIGRRKRELAGSGRGLLALVDDAPAGFIWWHDDPSRVKWISQLATRLPFRKRGLAATMVSACLETAYDAGSIAVVVNVDPANEGAFRLYRRLGFGDQVYALRTYTLLGEHLAT